MRTRKLAFEADSVEEYIQKSKISAAESQARANRIASHIISRGASPKAKSAWVDFEFTKASQYEQESSGNDSNDTNDNSFENIVEATTSVSQQNSKPVIKQFMVLGDSETGKHSLVNSAFGSQEENVSSMKQAMDLVIKSEQNFKYKFWISNIGQNQYESIVKVYYKTASAFFFVYSVTDKKSFQAVEKSIQQVMSEVSSENFNAVLIGTKSDLEGDRQVSLTEGLALQEKYGLKNFLETSQNDESLKQAFQSLNL